MNEVFGSPEQQLMQRRGEDLLQLLSEDARFCSHGRGVQLVDHGPDAVGLVVALAHLLGATGCEMVPKDRAQTFREELEAHGLRTYLIRHFIGGEDCVARAREALDRRPLPDDLTVRVIDRGSPGSLVEAFAEVALPHEVLPPVGTVMRGISRPGFGMVAFDADDRPVATAGSVRARHPAHAEADTVQWGQLATVPDRQGEGIARALGAMAILHAAEHLGAKNYRTGIAPGNLPSEALCTSLGLVDSAFVIVAAMDPEAFGERRLTK